MIQEAPMFSPRNVALSLSLVLLLTSCGGGAKVTARLDDLTSKNEELTRRVKNLEDELLAANKKLIQHEQALQQMHEQVRNMENIVNRLELRPTTVR